MDSSAVATKFVAGGIAGVSETLVTYPAEFCKTRRQLHVRSGAASPPSSLQILRNTVRQFGLSGVYSGVKPLAASNCLKSGIRFLAFETTRDQLDRVAKAAPGDKRRPWINVVSGLSAGAAESILVVTPGEALKTKMIHAASSSKSAAHSGLAASLRALVQQEGVRGLWSGLAPVLCKQATNSAVRFTTFSMLQERVACWWPSLNGNLGSTLVLGAISGVFTVYATMPFDNIKTRMQSVGARYDGMLDCAAKILKTDGVLALWRGTSPRLVRLTLSSGITFTVYDQVVRAAQSIRPERSMAEAQRL